MIRDDAVIDANAIGAGAGVRASHQIARMHPKIDPVGKPTHDRTADLSMDEGKRRRVGCDPLESFVDRVRESPA
jgi:hypothetical protein